MPVKLVQKTDYPESESTELRFQLRPATEFTVYIRMPRWVSSPAEITVNDNPVSAEPERGQFAAIRRRWENHHSIQVGLPFSFRAEPVDEHHPETVARLWGPLMLVALSPPPKLPRRTLSAPGE